jgi:hypothetical protein
VPGKYPAEAIREYLEPLQQSLSCISPEVLRPSAYETDVILAVTIPRTFAELITKSGEVLRLSFIQTFSVGKSPFFRRFKVTTQSYFYALENDAQHEIFAFHWHPESETKFPHLHIGHGAGNQIRPEIRNIHFQTARVAFEEFCQILLKEFGVVPERSDAEKVLSHNLDKFKDRKTW